MLRKSAVCQPVSSVYQDLNPGRTCKDSHQCKSNFCNIVCVGLEDGKGCHSHSDCAEGSYCMEETEWPHMTKCAPLKKTGDKCADDFQCPISHFCWYQGSSDVENGIKRCMEMYTMKNGEDFGWSSVTHSQGGVTDDIEDFERNGKACKTGLAYNAGDNKAVCVSADKVTFRDSVIYEPYPCSPRDPNDKCHIVYKKEDGSEGFA